MRMPTPQPARPQPARPQPGRPYHHGDLRHALLAEAERLLEAGGVAALTLRAVARGAGVTHAAPANHFGDLAGLLSDLAADGYRRLGAALAGAMAQAPAGRQAGAMGRAYVAFALAHPGLFALMGRPERLDPARPALRDALAQARAALESLVAARPHAGARTKRRLAAQQAALWSLVHGYAVLALDGRFAGLLATLPGTPDETSFLDDVLGAVTLAET